MKKLKTAFLGVGLSALLLGTSAFAEQKADKLPVEEVKQGQIKGVASLNDGALYAMVLDLKDGKGQLLGYTHSLQAGTYEGIRKEMYKDFSETEADLETVTGYTKNDKFYIKKLEINDKTFSFE